MNYNHCYSARIVTLKIEINIIILFLYLLFSQKWYYLGTLKRSCSGIIYSFYGRWHKRKFGSAASGNLFKGLNGQKTVKQEDDTLVIAQRWYASLTINSLDIFYISKRNVWTLYICCTNHEIACEDMGDGFKSASPWDCNEIIDFAYGFNEFRQCCFSSTKYVHPASLVR